MFDVRNPGTANAIRKAFSEYTTDIGTKQCTATFRELEDALDMGFTAFFRISTPCWRHFRSHQVVGEWTYEFLVVILPIQCASSSTLSRFLRVVYRREFLYRTHVLVISTPRWGHFRSHQVVEEWTYEFLVVILPIQCASSSTLSGFQRVVYRRGSLYITDLAYFWLSRTILFFFTTSAGAGSKFSSVRCHFFSLDL
jgi:hypothetical protein